MSVVLRKEKLASGGYSGRNYATHSGETMPIIKGLVSS